MSYGPSPAFGRFTRTTNPRPHPQSPEITGLSCTAAAAGRPLLTVLGGKITTYRRLAEEAVDRLASHLAIAGRPWTASAPLPGGDLPASDIAAFVDDLARRHNRFDRGYLARLARRHGRIAEDVLGDARGPPDLGRHVGADLYEREVLHMAANEWARRPEDVLWRRTKTGVHLSAAERRIAAEALAAML